MHELSEYCSWADEHGSSNLQPSIRLSAEIESILELKDSTQYLDSLSQAALIPQYTDKLFVLYEPLFIELASRWSRDGSTELAQNSIPVLAGFARLLPAKPNLRLLLESFLRACEGGFIGKLRSSTSLQLLTMEEPLLLSFLLALFRLYTYDLPAYSGIVSPVQLSSLLGHQSSSVRYLSVRCLAMYLRLADDLRERMVSAHIREKNVTLRIDGHDVPLGLFALFEERRQADINNRLLATCRFFAYRESDHPSTQSESDCSPTRSLSVNLLSPSTACLGGALLPRIGGSPAPGFLVETNTTRRHLGRFAESLPGARGILLTGPSGSGKTFLATEAANVLNKSSSMVTLHLNEQTDAKSLLGFYTSSLDGSFVWQQGILTQAMLEGRWVLVEDIHRVSSEVAGTLLPAIDKGEIYITSRNETVRAASGFCVLATTGEDQMSGSATSRLHLKLNTRLWQIVMLEPLRKEELQKVLSSLFPALVAQIPSFIALHHRILQACKISSFKSTGTRLPHLRDLMKLCGRSQSRFEAAGLKAAGEPIPQNHLENILKDAFSCYVIHIPSGQSRDVVADCIAEVLQIPKQRMDHYIHNQTPSLTIKNKSIHVGRSSVSKLATETQNGSRRNSRRDSSFCLSRGIMQTMEEIAAAIQHGEPTLLVGETGIGKTSIIQHLAMLGGQKLNVFNLSQQSESTDLLGGFKPITLRSMILPTAESFDSLFDDTFSAQKNSRFQASVRKCVLKSNWPRLVTLWQEAADRAEEVFRSGSSSADGRSSSQPSKKRKVLTPRYELLQTRWNEFSVKLGSLKAQVSRGDKSLAFGFVEGKLVHALRNGEWVLLDELNLASQETLESIADLLHSRAEQSPSLLLTDSGSLERVQAQPNFHLFAAMNPATDTGKQDLPPALRIRFTEIFVEASDKTVEDLTMMISGYLGTLLNRDKKVALDLANSYLSIQKLTESRQLTDGVGETPHFSLRSLVRTLLYANQNCSIYGLRRALYEGALMNFTTVLDRKSARLVIELLEKNLFGGTGNLQSLLHKTPKSLERRDDHVAFKHYSLQRGERPPKGQPYYIVTPSVERNLCHLARAASMKRFPILLQGPTASGKTSMIEYLANISGNVFIRINNHEHTDLQEYLGFYGSAADGSFSFREGVLVEALRKGYWVVLDELNLAPTDVLEALNRLLDDNRELYIPETQETVKPHPNFILFATQNPAGLYGGRKNLSRAFRNRFLEIHFDETPEDELEAILQERTQIAPSFCKKIVAVYKTLSMIRQSSRLFEQRNSFATLRDLFRWAARSARDREELAVNGFMLIAERVREPAEVAIVKGVIEEVIGVKIDAEALYSSKHARLTLDTVSGIAWTTAMRRLAVLVLTALENREPILLVGGTGCGKTQICQTVVQIMGQQLHILNAHANLETGDLIGAQRPVRNKAIVEGNLREHLIAYLHKQTNGATASVSMDELIKLFEQSNGEEKDKPLAHKIQSHIAQRRALFEWADGPLVHAMKTGEPFLLDEISLAEDSVLERMNSVLESDRGILVAEKGLDGSYVTAAPGFQFLATMNPGGDFGKRELSTALRNRFTEIWVPPLSDDDDLLPILQFKLGPSLPKAPSIMINFSRWFRETFHPLEAGATTLRELLTWASFIHAASHENTNWSLTQGAALVFIDSIGANPAGSHSIDVSDIRQLQDECVEKLADLTHDDVRSYFCEAPTIKTASDCLQCGPFKIVCGSENIRDAGFVFDAPTTRRNAFRVVRALQLPRPVLLEGDPGVGKTALIEGLAQACRKHLTRINLSEQTDLMDLFGSDVPLDDHTEGLFGWRDGPLLQAMQNGGWVLLDEMNLASQTVLEGLNSCFDHRQEVYIPELDRKFHRHADFALFATQNPHHQGGGRKGLPASFVNRFTVVYADALTEEDLKVICEKKFGDSVDIEVSTVIKAISRCQEALRENPTLDSDGGPWELNFRDLSRWISLHRRYSGKLDMAHFCSAIVLQRFRTFQQRDTVQEVLAEFLSLKKCASTFQNLSVSSYQIGIALLERDLDLQPTMCRPGGLRPSLLSQATTMIHAVNEKWPVLLVGASGSGKTSLIRHLAELRGARLVEIHVTEGTDISDLIGGFEQQNSDTSISTAIAEVQAACLQTLYSHALVDTESMNERNTLLELYRISTVRGLSIQELIGRFRPFADYISRLGHAGEALAKSFAHNPRATEASFVWTDGLLVEAVSKGYWLVLDNANTCSPAVLDRINSLLEPGGQLIISEQHVADGRPRTIKPHPNFRIFMTMNPQRGEISRAMRNRSAEIFIDNVWRGDDSPKHSVYSTEARIFRLRRLHSATVHGGSHKLEDDLEKISMSSLSRADISLLPVPEDMHVMMSRLDMGLPSEKTPVVMSRDNNVICFTGPYQFLPEFVSQHIDAYHNEAALCFPQMRALTYDQPIHPEMNEPLQQLTESSSLKGKPAYLAWLLKSHLILATAWDTLSIVEATSRDWSQSKIADSRNRAAIFNPLKLGTQSFSSLIEFFQSLVSTATEALRWIADHQMSHEKWSNSDLGPIIDLVQELVDFNTLHDLQDDALSIYLQDGLSMRTQQSERHPQIPLLQKYLSKFKQQVKSHWGQSLSQLWPLWTPKCAKYQDQVDALKILDEAMHAIDGLELKSTKTEKFIAAQVSLLEAYNKSLRRTGWFDDIFDDVKDAVHVLQREIPQHVGDDRIYFMADFEALCRYDELQVVDFDYKSVGQDLMKPNHNIVLAGRTMKGLVTLSRQSPQQTRLALLGSSPAPNDNDLADSVWKNTFPQGALQRILDMREISISCLPGITKEVECLAKSMSNSSTKLMRDQNAGLAQMLLLSVRDVLMAHRDLLNDNMILLADSVNPKDFMINLIQEADRDIFHANVPLTHHFRNIWQRYLQCTQYLHPMEECNNENLGLGLLGFALASLQLWLPETLNDPAVASHTHYQSYSWKLRELENEREALALFEQQFSGQRTSLRIRTIEAEIHDLRMKGASILPSPAIRPKKSNIKMVQETFSSIFGVLSDSKTNELLLQTETPFPKHSAEVKVLQRNIQQTQTRLSGCPPEYKDLTLPTSQLLHILDLGIRMREWAARARHSEKEKQLSYRVEHTILLGATPETLTKTSPTLDGEGPMGLYHLKTFGLIRKFTPWTVNRPQVQQRILSAFESAYTDWRVRLEADRAKETRNAKYYEYRGGDEAEDVVEDARFKELFPAYDDDEPLQRQNVSGELIYLKSLAAQMADLQTGIYSSSRNEPVLRDHLISETTSLLGSLKASGYQHVVLTPAVSLPALFVFLVEEVRFLDGKGKDARFNIYTDSNPVEMRKILPIADSIRSHFTRTGQKWPEHALPADILRSVTELGKTKISDPVAKVFPKMEKLHVLLNEWQKWAEDLSFMSQMIDQVTALIVHWRMLELSSWSRLLDQEQTRFEEDAKSWWFIVYEVVISMPRKLLLDGDDCTSYAREMAGTLIGYLKDTNTGQFTRRLQILRTFRTMLISVVDNGVDMSNVLRALSNVLDYFQRHKPSVLESLAKQRLSLQEEIEEQIKLASWRDQNVVALRDSARKTHHKLFKVVKKFTKVLSKPIDLTTKTNGGDRTFEPLKHLQAMRLTEHADKGNVLRLLEIHVTEWNKIPERLRSPDSAARSMYRLYRLSSTFDAASELQQYTESLGEHMAELRSQTPSMLNSENKELILHLKSRKRRLFADVLKELKQMGIRRNLNSTELEGQRLLGSVLSKIALHLADDTESPEADQIRQYASSARLLLYDFLDILEKCRAAEDQHSDDLTRSDVSRCLGYLEGLLLVLSRKANILEASITSLASMRRVEAMIANLRPNGPDKTVFTSKSDLTRQEQIRQMVSWLPDVLKLANQTLLIQSEHVDMPFTTVIEGVQKYVDRLEAGKLDVERCLAISLPASMHKDELSVIIDSLEQLVSNLRQDLKVWASAEPLTTYMMEHLLPWTDWSSVTPNSVSLVQQTSPDFNDYVKKFLRTTDKIFVSMQNLNGNIQKLPDTTESRKWLMLTDHVLESSFNSLHLGAIATEIEDSLDLLSSFQDLEFQKAVSLWVFTSPIICQFSSICHHVVQRYAHLNTATCRLASFLAHAFNRVSSEGFCSPSDGQSSGEKESDQLEQGTGLAEGEGAGDISNDIGDDEDISELAQQQQENEKNDVEAEENAVNMDREDLAGQFDEHGEAASSDEEERSSGEEGESEIDEESGQVDDLDPSAVDEKMWDQLANEKDKEMEGESSNGQKQGEKTAAQNDQRPKQTDEKQAEASDADDADDGQNMEDDMDESGQTRGETQDQYVPQEQALDLPDELDLDENKAQKDETVSDDGMGELSDISDQSDNEPLNADEDGDSQATAGDEVMGEAAEHEKVSNSGNDDQADIEDKNEAANDEAGSEAAEETDRLLTEQDQDDTTADDVFGDEKGASGEMPDDAAQEEGKGSRSQKKDVPSSIDQPENDGNDEGPAENQQGTSRGGKGPADLPPSHQNEDSRHLGDMSERYHRQRREILQASDESHNKQEDVEMIDVDFEHVRDKQDQGDGQALGAADHDQAQALDESKAIEDSNELPGNDILPPDVDRPEEGPTTMDLDPQSNFGGRKEGETKESGLFTGTVDMHSKESPQPDGDIAEDIADDPAHPDHKSPPLITSPTSTTSPKQLWKHFSRLVHPLSLQLTQQLHLILVPTSATRLSGAHRTGKRLNMKRIIPYIASNYRRDKIWMRRSVPSKRTYQIMLAVDDSKSMREGTAHTLAFESLALLTKSLSMLEVGDLCIVAFGNEDHIRVAHPFGTAFTNDSGPKVFGQFTFNQDATNVKLLIQESINLFTEARAKASGPAADMWQLQLIISDGICEDHEAVARLVRRAREERIMVIFVIVDSHRSTGGSILDLTQAVFEPDEDPENTTEVAQGKGQMQLKMKRYLDSFPFPYYVVVRDVVDLPGVLSTALKGWFREVVDVR